jgi:two-component system phosphate regulon sensor histidine kinase PhoR
LIEIDKHINRGVTYILIYSLLGGFYFVLYYGFHSVLPPNFGKEPLLNTFLVLLLATAFVPMYRVVQRFVDTLFYGGWYDYRSALTEITKGLEQITELQNLADTISERLCKTLRLEDTCVFFRDLNGEFSVIGFAPKTDIGNHPPRTFSSLPKSSLTYLLKVGAVEKSSLRKALSMVALTPEERQLLESEQVHLWVPVIGHGQVLGLLALGPKFGGDVFGGEDMDILRLVARQVAPLVENIHLVTRLKRYASELEQRVEERTAELHSAKERVEAILASVGDGVVVTDLDWNVITANSAFERQVGYPTSSIVGQKLWSFVNVGDSPEIVAEIQHSLEREAIWTGELMNYTKDGTPYDVQMTITPVSDQSGHIIGFVGSQRDITRHKQLERIKDRLIFDVSHELRTPVTNLSLYLELLESGKTERWSEYMGVLKGETNRLIELIENVLDLSRLDMWRSKKIRFSAVDLNIVADQVVTAHRPLAESAGLELNFKPANNLPVIQGEQNQLARLITNLLSNAIRYTPTGQVVIRTGQECGNVFLQVQDTGIGIEAEDMPHIFDRFYRGRQVSQSKITGTGLGLAIVKEIVEIHEGRIDVQSEVGKGSTFTVWFPVSKEG